MMNRIVARIRSLLGRAQGGAADGDAQRLRFSWLDFKVGFRMLARYPGLTLVGTVAIAVAIALGSVYFEALNKWQNPRLPFRDGHRIVSIRSWDVNALAPEGRSLHDFAIWREQVKTIDHLGAAILFVRNLGTEDGRVEPVRGAEITANAFAMLGTAPLLGRTLTARDEQPGEPPVAVISHALWKTRFAGDPGAVGRTVKLGTASATIVGVMPEGFGFPVSQRVWAPLRVDGSTLAPRTGPAVSVFGRLAPGASMDDARAELAAIGARVAADYPATHRHLTPRVTRYAKPLAEGGQALMIRSTLYVVNVIFLLLLAIVCVNVATLVFARTATRSWEITVRTALGANRGRIIAQLFIEALVLAGIGAVLGLVIARVALGWGMGLAAGSDALPFWVDASLSWKTVLYTALLTLFGAAIIGVLPALRVTKIDVHDALRSENAARSGLRFGGFWTAVIVVQVAITVALLPLAGGGVFESNRFRQRAEGIGAERYLTATVDMDREYYGADSAAFATRARQSYDELERRLGAEPGVESVTFADRLPVMDQFKYGFEVDTAAGAPATGLRTSTMVNVSRGFFATFGASVATGRDFVPLDYETGRVVIVNESFARHVFGGRNPIGQRIRILAGEHSAESKEWYEIVGMVRDFGWQLPLPQEQSAVYRPRLPGPGADASLAVRVRDPEAFATRLRAISAAVDPTIRLTGVQPLAQVGGGEAQMNWTLTSIAWLVALTVLVLSATGIHALMSFTVSRRTREIGIRAALGATPGRIVAGIFSRAFLQIGVGVLAGSALAALFGLGSVRQVLLLLAADGLMLAVGLAACALPLRRALTIDPTDALRAEG
ncbi:MAG: Acidobacterial duplicated orphan permease (function unknown) [uncultured Gemmatimonadetes bacterium]|uniref:ABC transporter, fused permease protein n=1 Tax=uncultured Gemmatimonadota bacterium TaxID=203437 RepID=A0A6J4KBR5_9BACT|nr:MAG: Acidobacterial duplicated orphan permease (function unknown) [uncultured Gemmatimonadota bacterium]